MAVDGGGRRLGEPRKAVPPGADVASMLGQVSDAGRDTPGGLSVSVSVSVSVFGNGMEACEKVAAGKRKLSNGVVFLEGGKGRESVVQIVGSGYGGEGVMRDKKCKLCRQEFEEGRIYVQCSTCHGEKISIFSMWCVGESSSLYWVYWIYWVCGSLGFSVSLLYLFSVLGSGGGGSDLDVSLNDD